MTFALQSWKKSAHIIMEIPPEKEGEGVEYLQISFHAVSCRCPPLRIYLHSLVKTGPRECRAESVPFVEFFKFNFRHVHTSESFGMLLMRWIIHEFLHRI